jgi:RimJ/RimL family protein N-acetyltransferase
MNLPLNPAFQHLNPNRIEPKTFNSNQRAMKCYLKIGFKEVGRRQKARFTDGEHHDDVIMDIMNDE